jgi:23S rRNA pseudouridine1911/1915/1917 synthase
LITSERILYEDNHLIAINKIAGELVQPDKSENVALENTIKEHIRIKYNKSGDAFLGVIHRIDRPVSGCVIFAKTTKALVRMNEMFQQKSIQKTYWAIVKNAPPAKQATLLHYMSRNEKQNKSYTSEIEKKDWKKASLGYTLLASSDTYHLLEIALHTGRHHQIRAQLAAIACPIKGDLKYGFNRSNPDGSISLHARKIQFKHPVKDETVEIVAPTPNDKLWHFFETQIAVNE